MDINSYDKFCSFQYVSRETYEKFEIFNETLIKWQKSINLVSNSSLKHIWKRHFLDSAQLYNFTKEVQGRILDMGSGAGFPGVILAMMNELMIYSAPQVSMKGSKMMICNILRNSSGNCLIW